MATNLDFSSFLDGEHVDEGTKRDLILLFEYTQYLFDDDKNLTKTLNLNKEARDKLLDRIKETFEPSKKEDIVDENATKGLKGARGDE